MNLEERLRAARALFISTFREREEQIARCVSQARTGDEEGVQSLLHLLHTLTGSAGIHELPQLSRASSACLNRLRSTPLTELETLDDWAEIADVVALMRTIRET